MSIQRLLFFLLFVPAIAFGMEGEPEAKKSRVNLATILELGPWSNDLNVAIANLEIKSVLQILQNLECARATKEERDYFYDKAMVIESALMDICDFVYIAFADATDVELLSKFSVSEPLKKIGKIKKLLYAYKFLDNFKFPQVYFNQRPFIKGVTVSLDKILEALILNEQKGIRVCCYHLTLYNIAKQLVDQKNNGVDVDILTNQSQGNDVPLCAIQHLVENRISVAAPRGYHEDNHHKFIVFISNVLDKQLLWTGSLNLTGHANESSWDAMNLIDDEIMVQKYIEEFDRIKAVSAPITQDELLATSGRPMPASYERNNVPSHLRN